ncbi:DUF3667 domain-containing protein [Rubrivirga sp.]|uniref:DUF3667 domain-containing protein n=1 Tax=Rubrivirga sp. TaxID=1885344 RepID=UPI003B529544
MSDLVLDRPVPGAEEESTGLARCAACDEPLVGAYCHECGERRPRPEDESLAAFLRDQFHEVTSADGRLWRSVKALFVPGTLTTEYFAGRRGLYVRPVRLFLVVNVVFFLWMSNFGAQAFLGDPGLYRSNPAFDARMTEAVNDAGVTAERYDAAFRQRARALAPTLIAVFVPAYVAFIALILVRTGRPVVRHAVFATHFVAVLMASSVLITAVLAAPLLAVLWLTGDVAYDLNDAVILPTMLVAWSAYLVLAFRRVYGLGWWGSAAAGLSTATVGTLVAMEVYRLVLFYVTLWTLDVPA